MAKKYSEIVNIYTVASGLSSFSSYTGISALASLAAIPVAPIAMGVFLTASVIDGISQMFVTHEQIVI